MSECKRAAPYPLAQVLALAYGTRLRLMDVPEWTLRARFDIVATMSPDTTRAERREMLLGLLEDRFGVRVRRELRSMPVLVLLRVRDDGRLGPELKQNLDCPPVLSEPPEPGCGSWMEHVGLALAMGSTWDEIFSGLRRFLELYLGTTVTTVVDRTDLAGRFDSGWNGRTSASLASRMAWTTGQPLWKVRSASS